MTSSAAPSYATTRSNTLGSRELSSCSRSLRIGFGLQGLGQGENGRGAATPPPPDRRIRRPPGRQLLSAPPANGWVAVLAPEMTASTRGWFFNARSIDSFTAL